MLDFQIFCQFPKCIRFLIYCETRKSYVLDAFISLSIRICQACGEEESEHITFMSFVKLKSASSKPERARCDSCWRLWKCVQCKRCLPKSEFSLWLDEFPSRRHTGRCKISRCNECVQETKDAATKLAKQDSDIVVKKRKRGS